MKIQMKITIILLLFYAIAGWGKCTYLVNPQDIELKFTGYKFTEKVAVSGSFKDIKWSFASGYQQLSSLLSSASVWIDSHSIDAGNAARNKNITKGLFQNIAGGRYIKGLINEVSSDSKSVNLKLFLGHFEVDIPMTLHPDNSVFILSGALDLVKARMKDAFQSLAKICGPFHQGKDGKRKTWPVVDLEVRAKYTEKCS